MTTAHWTDYGSGPQRCARTYEECLWRDELAAHYRDLRRDNPAMARLIFRRIKAAREAYWARFTQGEAGGAGLTGLLRGAAP